VLIRPRAAQPGHWIDGFVAGMMSDTRTEIVEALDRLNSLMDRRDITVLSEFDDRANVLLIGSEEGEIAEGPEALAALFRHVLRDILSKELAITGLRED
jgi:hypothetical protein